MKKEAVTTSPIASMRTDRVGYHASGMGLAIAFGAYQKKKTTEMDLRENRKQRNRFRNESVRESSGFILTMAQRKKKKKKKKKKE